MEDAPQPIIKKIDALQIPVPELEAGLRFYRDQLGHTLIWRTSTQAGLRMPETDAEIVLQTERPEMEVNLLVVSVDVAAEAIVRAGGSIAVPVFEIQIGKCVVVHDPWGNRLVLLDMTKGPHITDEQLNVVPPSPE